MHGPPPDFEPRAYAPQRIAAMVATLAESGVSSVHALHGSQLDEAALYAKDTRVSYAQTVTVFRNALRLTRDPTLALRAGARMHVTAYGIWGYALLSSRTFADVLDFSAKYRRLIGPLADMRYDAAMDPATCEYEVLLATDPQDELYRFSLEFTYAAHLTLSRDLYGDAFGFSCIDMVCTEPEQASARQSFFGCPIRYAQPGNVLRFDPVWSGQAPRTHDPVTHAWARELCESAEAELAHMGGIAAQVRRALVEQMPWRFPSIADMARALDMEPRTLRRRLEAQGTSYRRILAQARRSLAIDYLRKTRMTTEEIASRLGYSDAANFRHAFARWTGKSPREYRRLPGLSRR